jgi:predicted AAA+ superfamily ATPase
MKTVPMNESLNDSERAALYGKFKVGKDSLISMLSDSKKLKDNCLAQEHQINISFNDLQSELRRTHDDLALLRENEIRFKKEILKK